MQKKISIIIPCYNSVKYIEECFVSVKNQTMGIEWLQVIFVNDASTDHTLEYLERYQKEYPGSVEVINLEKNRRQGGARNAGLAHAVGEYVMFLDSDDWLDEAMCEKTYRIAVEYDIDILQFPFIHVYADGECVKDKCNRYGFLDGSDEKVRHEMLVNILFTYGSQNKLYRRSLLTRQQACFPEHVVYQEPYFVYPLLFEAERFYSMREGLYFYRQTEKSVTAERMGERGGLYDHPFVQLELLKKLTAKEGYIEKYYSEMEFHFLYSYYIETLYFAGVGGKYLGVDYFRNMQNMMRQLFPEVEGNPYLELKEYRKLKEILSSIRREFTQEELEAYCLQVVQIIHSGKNGFQAEVEKQKAENIRNLKEQLAGYRKRADQLLDKGEYQELMSLFQADEMKMLSKVENEAAQFLIILSIYEMERQEGIQSGILTGIHTMEEARERFLRAKFLMWRLEFLGEAEALPGFLESQRVSVPFLKYLVHTSSFRKADTAWGLAMLLKENGKLVQAFAMLNYVNELKPDMERVFCEMADICISLGQIGSARECLGRIQEPSGILGEYQKKWRI